ncbi:hypothetical protein L228DRAFT_90427 [Xylona heveae TC161]|uniref:Uncharacterized protein n=1 Tax=Xylona heveae (strain CBS 132557 / TC161) TaxID=1328760 RepID=A0A161TE18_XYLHT|nr:hypothetical protein L228DRAFT_90427 [Xylona heveae TC161]KZF24147.1 hypothetical protein L228DRAFT_90427 [Xylona heveae TC161]
MAILRSLVLPIRLLDSAHGLSISYPLFCPYFHVHASLGESKANSRPCLMRENLIYASPSYWFSSSLRPLKYPKGFTAVNLVHGLDALGDTEVQSDSYVGSLLCRSCIIVYTEYVPQTSRVEHVPCTMDNLVK